MKYIYYLLLIICCSGWTDKEVVEAIYKAEGSDKAKFAYGIRSIKYKNKAQARQYCFNTVRNQRVRHSKHDCGLDYISCLAARYCPIGADNDKKGVNVNWKKNVNYFLNKDKMEVEK